MAKSNMYHLFATAMILIRSRRKRRIRNKKKRGRRFWVRPLFADRVKTGAYQS